ncbi:soluble cytochrome b562 [Paenibacillus shirakamiensis]|uniref:Soluble cytochrome b562 n=1 Tax=Paenibacillus shirakamiensis TaxID=1265935 RepID=A0ABS4JI58_9BACL|nr:DUF4358 domain-containing protein [Paenibacillus shirakamiensis]MBP2000755.1 soluble cytochrome b562 [Paenibacillus shirakamiensis]
MKKNYAALLLVFTLVLVLSACGSKTEKAKDPGLTTTQMADQMLKKVEQPQLMEVEPDLIKSQFHLDPALLDQSTIRMPLMNVKTNEIAILKVKDAKDLATVQASLKQRATDVQKQFEHYLPDQYENAKNYKIVTEGNYVFYVISDKADTLVGIFQGFFTGK